MENHKEIENKLGIEFKNKDLLERAFIHRSYINENRGKVQENNERLEFLGDAVLELIISAKIYTKYQNKSEGDLTAIRSAVVRTESLASQSRELGLGEYLLMSRGEEESGGKDKDFLLANLFEAVLGAIYLDKGYSEAENFINRTLVLKIEKIVNEESFIDPKTKVQEVIQSKYKETPTYEVIKEEGPDHDKYFTIGLKVGNKVIAEGYGSSKQKAEEEAAKKALEILNK
ncbi:ribonuclease III [Candidatus Microgenomates bacterium]|jgi:ribonuclease-3|nr:ribonuclease III [Candidatus Microgenomates bacterium]